LIKIWTRDQILAQKSTFSELPQNERECSPRRHESNATCFVSNERREREIWKFVRQVKQAKFLVLTVQSVQSDVARSYRPYDDMSGDDVARNYWLAAVESGSDTCPLVANGVRTRGPICGHHVSLVY
jgi:hypothetical protein